MLTFALPTGRSLEDCIEILEGSGLPVDKLKNHGRNLVVDEGSFRYLLSKPSDVPAMVHYGAADLAIAGNDVVEESGTVSISFDDYGAKTNDVTDKLIKFRLSNLDKSFISS